MLMIWTGSCCRTGNVFASKNSAFAEGEYTLQDQDIVRKQFFYYVKIGKLVHVYFSAYTLKTWPADTYLTLEGLPKPTEQQDCRSVPAYGLADIEAIAAPTRVTVGASADVPADGWVRFNFQYIIV